MPSSACDQVIEQTSNRNSRTKGGLTGFTLNRSAVQRWILAQSERGSMTRQCYSLAGFTTSDRYGIAELTVQLNMRNLGEKLSM